MIFLKRILYFFCSTCRPNRSRTVRYAFPLVLSALVILGAVTVASIGQTTIEIVPSKSSVRAGEMISLDVYVTAQTPINAIDLQIEVPEDQLDVTVIDTGESVITLWTKDPYVKNDFVYLSGGTFRRGFSGRHKIATINAKAIQTGIAHVSVTESLLLAGDGSGTEVKPTLTNKDKINLYIAKEDGTFTGQPGEGDSLFKANASVFIVTDIDGDGQVTLADISRFMSAWFKKDAIFDFSGDGKMTFRDFSIILADAFFR